MSQEIVSFEIEMSKTGPMQFTTKFDKDYPDLLFDEPKQAGGNNEHPNASRVLTAAIANCLSASLLFCMSKTRIEIPDLIIKSKATCYMERNNEGRWRINKVEVKIFPKSENYNGSLINALNRCKEKFSDYCTVSQSIRTGFDIDYQII